MLADMSGLDNTRNGEQGFSEQGKEAFKANTEILTSILAFIPLSSCAVALRPSTSPTIALQCPYDSGFSAQFVDVSSRWWPDLSNEHISNNWDVANWGDGSSGRESF